MLTPCCIPPAATAASLASAAQRNVLSSAFPRGALASGYRAWTVQAARAMAASGPGQQGESQGVELSKKKCVPCESKDMRPMSRESAEQLVQQVPGWEIVEQPGSGGLSLHRDWKSKTFVKGLDFFKSIAEVAEAEGHHPDLHLVGWNRVSADISTHAVGGLTENDFILAAKINALDTDHLLRKQSAAKSSVAGAVAEGAAASPGM